MFIDVGRVSVFMTSQLQLFVLEVVWLQLYLAQARNTRIAKMILCEVYFVLPDGDIMTMEVVDVEA